MKVIVVLLLLSLLVSCKKQELKHTIREIETKPTDAPPAESKITPKEKYQYKGDKYPDPFSETIVIEPIKDHTLKYAISPDLRSLKISGVMRDKKSIYILLESPIGNYIIEGKKMSDINLRPVKDIKVNFDKSILILQKGDETREIDLSPWGGSK